MLANIIVNKKFFQRIIERFRAVPHRDIMFVKNIFSIQHTVVYIPLHIVSRENIKLAVRSRETFVSWIEKYGPDRIILGADVRDNKIAVSGWLEASDYELIPFVSGYMESGINKVITTDIGRDGMLQGPSLDLYRKMLVALPDICLIASGGVSSLQDIEELEGAGVQSVIFGKAIYEGHIRLKDLQRFF